VPPSCEASLFYYQQAARQAEQAYNTRGGQTRVESVILREGLELTRQDHLGEEDARNAYLRNRAELGDGPAAASLGTRYYWGTHGLEQNHARALKWYRAALKQKNIAGLVGAAKMLLKGEGGQRDMATALAYMNEAAELGNAEAMNALGFMYFNGDPLPQNYTKALEYFTRSAEKGSADGMLNAGMCHLHGLGSAKDLLQALALFTRGAHMGSLRCIMEAANILSTGAPGIKRYGACVGQRSTRRKW
jgi:TPR repeat protein